MTNPEDNILRDAARKIHDAHLRHIANDPDMEDARRGFYTVMIIVFRSMLEAGWNRFNALVMIATMAWLTMNDVPPPQQPPEEN